jgi:hypothetical protein
VLPCVGCAQKFISPTGREDEDATLAQPKPNLFMHIGLYTRLTSETANVTYYCYQ